MFAGHTVRRTVLRGIVLLVIGYVVVGWFTSGLAGKVNELKNGSELALRIATGAPVLVDFTASWCMPCKMMAPELDQVAKANKKIEFYKVDIDQHADVAEQYRVASVPAVYLFNRGKEAGRFTGSRDRNFIQTFLDESLQA